jgi:hypothetical protein
MRNTGSTATKTAQYRGVPWNKPAHLPACGGTPASRPTLSDVRRETCV